MQVPADDKQHPLYEISLGNHLCSIYKDKKQEFKTVIPFITDGLKRNQKIFFISDNDLWNTLTSECESAGFPLQTYLESKQCMLLTKKETYLVNGDFNPERMIGLGKKVENDALSEGYAGVRFIGEMTWVLDDTKNNEKLIEYERKLCDYFKNSKTAALCLYDEGRFDPKLLINIIRAHPAVFIYGTYYVNKYFYTEPKYVNDSKDFQSTENYQIILDLIREQ